MAWPGASPTTPQLLFQAPPCNRPNKVDQGVVIGRRLVGVTPNGATGGLSGAAAGGIAGSQVGAGPTAALGALGGSVVGGLVGSAVERSTGETKAYEYVVRKPNGELLSVTQQDSRPLEVGQNVLVIAGNQARIVADYTVTLDPAPPQPQTQPVAPPPAPVNAAPLAPPAASTPASPPSE